MSFLEFCRCAVPLLLAVVGGLTGCTRAVEVGQIAGRVTYGGEPVDAGAVVFSDATRGIYMTADLDGDGRYRMVTAKGPGLPLGTYQVAVNPPQMENIIGRGLDKLEEARKDYPNIPASFRDAKTSGLSVEVKSGDNVFDIEMKK